MNAQPKRDSLIQSESGQAAAMVALLLFFIFSAFAALAIDGAMTYSVRRNLQNVADASALAACRVLSNGGTIAAAYTEAENSISNNLGAWQPFIGNNPPSTNVGTGSGLVYGLEVSTYDVRVAVQRQVPTVLAQFFGRAPANMVGLAHCDSRGGGGLMPIAVRRYNGLSGPQIDFVAKQGAPAYGYYLAGGDSITTTWSPARYPNSDFSLNTYDLMVPCGNPDAPACAGGVSYVAGDSAVPGVPDANSGPSVEILGAGALPNFGNNSYDNFVMPDIRNIEAGDPYVEYYHGATGNPQTDKDISQQYIYSGYPGPYFVPGEEMAVLAGAGARFEAHSVIGAGYRVGDTITVMVYDGNIWDTPDFTIGLTPQANNGIATVPPVNAATAVAYNVTIATAGSATWRTALNFSLTFNFSEKSSLNAQTALAGMHARINSTDLSIDPTSASFVYSVTNVTQATGWSGTLYVWNTNPVSPTLPAVPTYLSGLNMLGDNNQGLIKGTSSHFGFGLSTADYTVRSGQPPSGPGNQGPGRLAIAQGQSASPTTYLITHGFGGANCSNAKVTASIWSADGTTQQNWTDFFPSAEQTTQVAIKNITDNNLPNNYSLDAYPSVSHPLAAPQGSYILRFTVQPNLSGGQCSALPPHSVDVPLDIVQPPSTNSTPKQFVVFQGYAVFRVSDFTPNMANPNTVWGYAISPLYRSMDQFTFGLQPRLIPW